MTTKNCGGCGRELPAEGFYRNSKNGRLSSRCRECTRERVQKWRSADPERAKRILRADYERHREKRLAQAAEYRATNADAVRQRKADYYRRNAERLKAKQHDYRAANPEVVRERNRRYHERNPKPYDHAYYKAHKATFINAVFNRRARKRGVGYVRFRRRDIYERDRGICGICGQPVDPDFYVIDHIVPLAKGGAHCPENVQTAHRSCNAKKWTRLDFFLHAS